MKRLIIILTLLLFFISCQREEFVVPYEEQQPKLQKSSDLTEKLLDVVRNNTVLDNILDDNNCYSIVLPATFDIGDYEITIEDKRDYQIIYKSILSSGNTITPIFPIIMKDEKYREIGVQNAHILEDLKKHCKDKEGYEYKEGRDIDFIYPIVVLAYNKISQKSDTYTIEDREYFYHFLKLLNKNIYLEIRYPIAFKDQKDEYGLVYSNEELLEQIKQVTGDSYEYDTD